MDARSRWKFGALTVLVFCTLAGSSVLGNNRGPKNVQVALRAKWSGTPLLLEAGELLSKEWKDLHWDFIDAWLENETEDSDRHTARDCFKKIVKCARSFLSEPLASVFEVSLALRSASPRLVLYRQLGKESLLSFQPSEGSSTGAVLESKNNTGIEKEGHFLGVNPKPPGGNCCWVDTGSVLLFHVAELLEWLSGTIVIDNFQQPELFDFDHVYTNSSINSPSAILYGALGTSCFKEFHAILSEASKQEKIKYVLRPILPSGCECQCSRCGAIGTRDPLTLGGYGVELALKNMEYKAMDDSDIRKGITLEDPHTEDLSLEVRGFIFSRIRERKPEFLSGIMAFRDYLLASTISDTLNVWELKDLGHQTAQRILLASDPFQSMQEISHNFPSVVSSLSRTKLNDSIKEEIISNQQMIPPGKSLMALNGALVSVEDIDLYMLIDVVHQELSLADQFLKLQIPQNIVKKLLLASPSFETNVLRVDFRSSHVHYVNNLEKDAIYKRWRSNINEILMPVFPGQLRYIRKNIFHAVYVFDPASTSGLEVVDMIISLYENSLPLRFGVMLYSAKLIEKFETSGMAYHLGQLSTDSLVGDDLSTMIIRIFLFIQREYGIETALQFLSNINKARIDSETPGEYVLELHQIEGAFVDTLSSKTKSSPQDLLLKLEEEPSFRGQSEESSLFVHKMGLEKLRCSLLMNGLVFDSSEEDLVSAVNDELPRIQEHVYNGRIDSHTDVLDKLLSETGIKRYNPQIYGGKIKPKYISLSTPFLTEESVLKEISYLHTPSTIDDLKPVTHLLVIDITKRAGWKLLHEGIRYLLGDVKLSRLGVLFSVSPRPNSPASVFMQVFQITASLYSHKKNVVEFLYQVARFYGDNYLIASDTAPEKGNAFLQEVLILAEVNSLPSDGYKHVLSDFSWESLRDHLDKVMKFLYKHVDVASNANAVLTNGRVFVVDDRDSFLSDDLHLLEHMEFEQKIKQVAEIFGEVNWVGVDPDIVTSTFISDIIMLVSSSTSSRYRSSESARFEVLGAKHSAIILSNDNSSIHIDAVIDPLSSVGQKLSALLYIVQRYVQPSMRIVLNSLSSLVDLPLKNFYRYVVPAVDDFSSSDSAVNGSKAFFANMPLSKTLTMNLDVPESWLVEPIIAVHDLDNILLENLRDTRTLTANFELEALVLTGHCSERDRDSPRGLQLILGTKSFPHLVDTLVMANLGYWQMKVSPGVWYLQLAGGRSSDLYMLKDDSGHVGSVLTKRITIDDLRGKLVHLEVGKKEGKEHEKLLLFTDGVSELHQNDEKSHSNWNSNLFKWASSLIGGNVHTNRSGRSTSVKRGDGRRHGKAINIFSIASGHLYERFLKIMILSVLKNTNRPVKFWFIKNYLSPQFKDVIPHMAQEYGFEYELVTYKWPSWLHKQKEKQRIIWAYKILFLDVIFPLSLEKVIFVDADQVVRADMGELYEMNINGRPLAYTPFCDNNKDMDGYRFWRQGFWKEHLRDKPYHISALYVVDLIKFRETAAGDNLRVIYETLSKDPNSLANLDQDLPNYAQHTVPIFSLPQEWLWCESWCGDATKSKAKTIDLCNNPMTKEPKLQGARRIVPEWLGLDMEARNFTARILGEVDSQEPAVSHHHQGTSDLPTSTIHEESKSEL